MDNVKPMIENIEWLSAADRKKIFEDNARAVFKVIVELESVTMHRLRIYDSNRSAVQDVQADQSERGVQRSIVQVQSQGGFQVQGSKFKVFHRGLDLQIIDVVAVVEGHL
jgi:Mg2+ and Co2+ transporter CorA